MKYYPMFDLFDDFFTGNTTSDVMKTDIVEKDGNYEIVEQEVPYIRHLVRFLKYLVMSLLISKNQLTKL